jgi:hypothetical protein
MKTGHVLVRMISINLGSSLCMIIIIYEILCRFVYFRVLTLKCPPCYVADACCGCWRFQKVNLIVRYQPPEGMAHEAGMQPLGGQADAPAYEVVEVSQVTGARRSSSGMGWFSHAHHFLSE